MRSAIVAALTAPGITAADLRVLLVVLELTAGHGKLVDRSVRSDIAERAGVSERTVTRSLTKWSKLRVVIWLPARARGQLGELALCCAPVEKPELLALTRDRWLSRVQPYAGQEEHERETNDDLTRDIGDVPLPPLVPPSTSETPRCHEHNMPFADSGFGTCGRCHREQQSGAA
jgi:hypothetical protein